MRNRKVQREVRRQIGREEKLEFRDFCGMRDPTPYEAVKNIIREDKVNRQAVIKSVKAQAATL